MTMENDARCSGGGGEGGSEAEENVASVPDIDLEEDSSSQDQHNNNNNNTLATTHAASSHSLTPSSREMRNRAEKQRRDKLNTYISELASLNPLIAINDKKMDKTSILRLSAAYLRLHKTLVHDQRNGTEPTCCTPTPAATGAASGTGVGTNNSSSSSSSSSSSTSTPQVTLKTEVIHIPPAGLRSCSVLQERKMNNDAFHDEFNLPFNLTEQMLEFLFYVFQNMDGFLLILTSTGKVVYVSNTIGKLLGHSQNDLMGQSLYNITCPTDHDELRKNLQADNDDEPGPSNPETRRHRRSFFLKMSQRVQSRGEHIQYELVHVVGHLRVPGGSQEIPPPSTQLARKNTRSRDGNHGQQQNQHEIVLVAVGKMSAVYRRDLSILDASKDEYVTRHALDGNMVYVDHRISVVAGYMPEEVTGISAFRYMHEEDVSWTIVSLKQMYNGGGGYGSSTYRLINKTGQFIYLRTHGHLEYDEQGENPISFICINTLLSDAEGDEGVQEMRLRFSANIPSRDALQLELGNLFKLPAPGFSDRNALAGNTMDPTQLETLIMTHLSEVPASPASDDPVPDAQHAKCKLIERILPPPSTQLQMISHRRRESSAAGSPGSHQDQHPNSPTLVRNTTMTTIRTEHRSNNTRHTSPNGNNFKSLSPPNNGFQQHNEPHSPNYRTSSPILTKSEHSPYSQHSNSPPPPQPPPTPTPPLPSNNVADPMITGTGTCTTIMHSRNNKRSGDSYQSSTTNIVLETSVYEHVTSSTEIRRSRRGRPPRVTNNVHNNKRSLSTDDSTTTNNKRICSESEIFETDNSTTTTTTTTATTATITVGKHWDDIDTRVRTNNDNGRTSTTSLSSITNQQQSGGGNNGGTLESWEGNNMDSPASQNSLLSNNTDFSSIELDETGDPATDFQSLMPFDDTLMDMLRSDEEHGPPSRNSPSSKPASLIAETVAEEPPVHHHLKPNKLGNQTDIAGV